MLFKMSHGVFSRGHHRNLTLYVANNYLALSVQSHNVRISNMKYLSLSAEIHSIRIWKICFSAKCLFKCCLASGEKIPRH